MYPPIFSISSSNVNVQSIFGTAPCRVFLFGDAYEGVALPYAVWQTIGGSPENYIDKTPDIDYFLVQIDVYSSTAATARSGAEALRCALEPNAYITSWRGESYDKNTKRYRYSFDINFITPR